MSSTPYYLRDQALRRKNAIFGIWLVVISKAMLLFAFLSAYVWLRGGGGGHHGITGESLAPQVNVTTAGGAVPDWLPVIHTSSLILSVLLLYISTNLVRHGHLRWGRLGWMGAASTGALFYILVVAELVMTYSPGVHVSVVSHMVLASVHAVITVVIFAWLFAVLRRARRGQLQRAVQLATYLLPLWLFAGVSALTIFTFVHGR